MPTTVQFRRGTTSQNDSFTGASGEFSVDTDRDELRIHDGTTAGGHVIGDIGKKMDTANTRTLVGSRLGATSTVALTGDVTASATAFSGNAVSITTDIAASGTPTGTFGSGSLIPIVTVGADGRITNISNTAVAGVSSVSYTTANGNFRITTGDGTTHDATIASGMAVANTRTLVNSRLGSTSTVTLTGDVTGSASFSSNAVSVATSVSISSTDLSDISALLTSDDAFSDSNTAIMTAAAINDRIESLLPKIYDVNNTQVFP
jgi:hypothetical protein